IAEARSRNLAKLKKQTAHIRQIFEKAVKMSAKKVDGKKISAKLEIKEDRTYPNLVIPKDCPGLVNLIKAGAQEGYKIKAICCGGGFDANRMFPHGIKAIAIGFGMRNAHSVNETLELKDFFDCLKISLATVLNSAK
ncbi:MAG: M20/M25/M40 family metallo-hydrolase, partial [Elusimicrobia bacterium]|nr:M20/M25/M40 family metallo-hydrolase [Elusimicrobiota bacterium]